MQLPAEEFLVIVARCVAAEDDSVAGDHLRILGDPQWFRIGRPTGVRRTWSRPPVRGSGILKAGTILKSSWANHWRLSHVHRISVQCHFRPRLTVVTEVDTAGPSFSRCRTETFSYNCYGLSNIHIQFRFVGST